MSEMVEYVAKVDFSMNIEVVGSGQQVTLQIKRGDIFEYDGMRARYSGVEGFSRPLASRTGKWFVPADGSEAIIPDSGPNQAPRPALSKVVAGDSFTAKPIKRNSAVDRPFYERAEDSVVGKTGIKKEASSESNDGTTTNIRRNSMGIDREVATAAARNVTAKERIQEMPSIKRARQNVVPEKDHNRHAGVIKYEDQVVENNGAATNIARKQAGDIRRQQDFSPKDPNAVQIAGNSKIAYREKRGSANIVRDRDEGARTVGSSGNRKAADYVTGDKSISSRTAVGRVSEEHGGVVLNKGDGATNIKRGSTKIIRDDSQDVSDTPKSKETNISRKKPQKSSQAVREAPRKKVAKLEIDPDSTFDFASYSEGGVAWASLGTWQDRVNFIKVSENKEFLEAVVSFVDDEDAVVDSAKNRLKELS